MHVNSNDNGQTDEQKDGRTGGQTFLQDKPIDRQKDKHMHVNGNDNGQTDEQKDGRTGGQTFLQGRCPEDKRF